MYNYLLTEVVYAVIISLPLSPKFTIQYLLCIMDRGFEAFIPYMENHAKLRW